MTGKHKAKKQKKAKYECESCGNVSEKKEECCGEEMKEREEC